MNLAILQALALATGGLSSLGAVLMVLMLLNREAGPGSAFAFGLGYCGVYTAIASLAVFGAKDLLEARADAGPSPLASLALCVLGVLLMLLAIKQWRTPASDEAPAWLAQIDSFTPGKALGVGLLIPLINFKNLAIFLPAVAVLAAAPLTTVEAIVGVIAVPMVFCGAMLTPLLLYLVLPRRAARTLAALRRWVEAHSHTVTRVVLPVIATLLLVKGGRGLWTLLS